MTDDGAAESPLSLKTAHSDHRIAAAVHMRQQDMHAGSAIDGNLNTWWEPGPEPGQMRRQSAVFLPAAPVNTPPSATIVIRLVSESSEFKNIGRFRLSLTGDSNPLSTVQLHYDLQDDELVDLYAALGKSYGLLGRTEEALGALVKGLAFAGDSAAMTHIIDATGSLEGLLDKLADQARDNGLFQAALVQRYVEQQQLQLAATAQTQAISLLERAMENRVEDVIVEELAAVMLADTIDWTVLAPVETSSEGGATLTPQDDGSILASGAHPDRDVYTVSTQIDLENATAFRLEALPHDSLPDEGPWRGAGGHCFITELEILTTDASGAQQRVTLQDIEADFTVTDNFISPDYLIDGDVADDRKGWSINARRSAELILVTDEPVSGPTVLTFRITQNHFDDEHEQGLLLGCFRLSATADSTAFQSRQRQFAALQVEDLWARLGAAYGLTGDSDAAARHIARALDRETAEGHARHTPEIDLSQSAPVTEFNASLAAGGVVRGVAIDQDGQPLSDVSVGYRIASGIGFGGDAYRTDTEGRFRHRFLPLNTSIEVSLRKDDHISESHTIVLMPEKRELDVEYKLQGRPPGGSIAGVVTDAKGNPMEGASVTNQGNQNRVIRKATTNADGEFVLHELFESFTGHEISVSMQGFAPQELSVEPRTAESPGPVTVTLEPGHTIHGQVVDETKRPVKGAFVSVRSGVYPGGLGKRIRTTDDGRFAFNSLPPDARFDIQPTGYPILIDTPLQLDAVDPVIVQLEAPGMIRGRVVDAETNKPVPQFRVKLGFSRSRKPDDAQGTFDSRWRQSRRHVSLR